MPSVYNLNIESNKVFFRPERLIATIQEEIYQMPWFGHKEHVEPGLTAVVNDAFALFGNEREVCYCTMFSLISPDYKKLSSYYFPFILTSSEPADPPPGLLYVVLKCLDMDLYLYEAEGNKKFISTVMENMSKEAILNTEKKSKILFESGKGLDIQGTVRTFHMRKGETSNVLYRLRMDSGAFLFKSYRRISSRYEEVQTLKMLEEAGFKNCPRVVGQYYLGTEAKNKTLGVFMDYIQSNGSLEKRFTDSIQEAKEKKDTSGLLKETKKTMGALGKLVSEMHTGLSSTSEEIAEEDVDLYKEFFQTRVNRAYAAMETKMVEVPKEAEEEDGEEGESEVDAKENTESTPEEISEDPPSPEKEEGQQNEEETKKDESKDDEPSKETEIKSVIVMESTYNEELDNEDEEKPKENEEVELVAVPGPLAHLKDKAAPARESLDAKLEDFTALVGKKKQRLHQHLNLSQVIYDDNDLYITDFIGDPTRQGLQRVRPLPVEQDVASFLYSLDVFVKNFEGGNKKTLVEWKTTAEKAFMEGYGKKDLDQGLLDLYLVQAAVNELAFYKTFSEARVEQALDYLLEKLG